MILCRSGFAFRFCLFFCFLALWLPEISGQNNSIVKIDAGEKSGYGVAFQRPDLIVTALHVVAGRTPIKVMLNGKTVDAQLEKIYKDADLALLKLKAPLPGIQSLALWSGPPPFGEDVEYWEVPRGSSLVVRKTTKIDKETRLSNISARVNPPPNLENALCKLAGAPYPGLNSEVINFVNVNIGSSHSGSALTKNGKIIGMIDGGANLVDAKNCIWAIHKDDIAKLLSQGTAPPANMSVCASSGATAKHMYSGTRSDNPNLTPEQREAALLFEAAAAIPIEVIDNSGDTLRIYHDQRMSFGEIFETLQSSNKQRIEDLFADELAFDEQDRLSHEDLMDEVMDLHQGNTTGASLIIPKICQYSISQNVLGNVIAVASPLGHVNMYVYLSKNNTPEEATQEMIRFKEMLHSLGQQTDPTKDNVKDYNCEPDDPYYREYIENSDIDEQTHALISEFSSSMTINKSDFLGVWLEVSDWKEMWSDKEIRKFYYLLQSGLIFADYAIY